MSTLRADCCCSPTRPLHTYATAVLSTSCSLSCCFFHPSSSPCKPCAMCHWTCDHIAEQQNSDCSKLKLAADRVPSRTGKASTESYARAKRDRTCSSAVSWCWRCSSTRSADASRLQAAAARARPDPPAASRAAPASAVSSNATTAATAPAVAL